MIRHPATFIFWLFSSSDEFLKNDSFLSTRGILEATKPILQHRTIAGLFGCFLHRGVFGHLPGGKTCFQCGISSIHLQLFKWILITCWFGQQGLLSKHSVNDRAFEHALDDECRGADDASFFMET